MRCQCEGLPVIVDDYRNPTLLLPSSESWSNVIPWSTSLNWLSHQGSSFSDDAHQESAPIFLPPCRADYVSKGAWIALKALCNFLRLWLVQVFLGSVFFMHKAMALQLLSNLTVASCRAGSGSLRYPWLKTLECKQDPDLCLYGTAVTNRPEASKDSGSLPKPKDGRTSYILHAIVEQRSV